MRDDELDDALTALRVDPSADFPAKVRARVADESIAVPWRFGAMQLVAPGVMLVAALVFLVVSADVQRDTASTIRAREIVAARSSAGGSAEPTVPGASREPAVAVAPSRTAGIVRSVERRPRDVPADELPPVLLSDAERDGIRLLLDAIADDRLTSLPRALTESTTLAVTKIEIAPIEVPALSSGSDEGEVQ